MAHSQKEIINNLKEQMQAAAKAHKKFMQRYSCVLSLNGEKYAMPTIELREIEYYLYENAINQYELFKLALKSNEHPDV